MLNRRELHRLEAMLDLGLHPKRIATALNCSLDVVSAAAAERGRPVMAHKSRRVTVQEIEWARRQRAEGATFLSIARALGRNIVTIQKMDQCNYETPKPTSKRPCITCRRPMYSEGAHNRQCQTCRQESDTVFTATASMHA